MSNDMAARSSARENFYTQRWIYVTVEGKPQLTSVECLSAGRQGEKPLRDEACRYGVRQAN
jgi:hypothetical protein